MVKGKFRGDDNDKVSGIVVSLVFTVTTRGFLFDMLSHLQCSLDTPPVLLYQLALMVMLASYNLSVH